MKILDQNYSYKQPWVSYVSAWEFSSFLTKIGNISAHTTHNSSPSKTDYIIVWKDEIEAFDASDNNNKTQEPTLWMPGLHSDLEIPYDPYDGGVLSGAYQLKVCPITIKQIDYIIPPHKADKSILNQLISKWIILKHSTSSNERIDLVTKNVSNRVSQLLENPFWYIHSENIIPSILVGAMNSGDLNNKLEGVFSKAVGVWENNPLGSHTESVIRIFERWKEGFIKILWKNTYNTYLWFLRILLLFHDIGKGIGFSIDWHTRNQSKYTQEILLDCELLIKDTFKLWEHFTLIQEVLKVNLWSYLYKQYEHHRGNPSHWLVHEYVQQIQNWANKSWICPKLFYNFLYIFFKCDTAAYTPQSWGYMSRAPIKDDAWEVLQYRTSLHKIYGDASFSKDGTLPLLDWREGLLSMIPNEL